MLARIFLFILSNSLLQRKSKIDSPKRQIAQIKLVEDVLEYIQGMSVVKSFSLNNNQIKKLINLLSKAGKEILY